MYKLKGKKTLVIAIILAISIGLNGCAQNEEGLVAKVNGEGITQEEYDIDFQVYKNIYEKQLGEGALSEIGSDGKTFESSLKQDVLDKLIVEKLIIQEATKKDITVTDEEVEEKIDQLIASFGGEDKYEEFLEKSNIPKDYFKENTKREILIERHKGNFLEEESINEEEAEKYFNENKEDLTILKASHILVNNEEDGNKVLERLKNGEDFSSVAVTESLDSTSAVKGGDLGYFVKGTFGLIPEFQEAAFNLEVGEISDLVKTEVGYHIIYLEDRKDTFDDLKEQIVMLLKEQGYAKHIQGLKDSAKIKTYLEIEEEK